MGVKNPRQYTLEFKRQAVQLAEDLKSSLKAATQLGIPKASLYTWRAQAKMGALGGANSAMAAIKPQASSSEEEIRRLQREVAELKKVNHILKAAAAFFSQDHLK